ncbi:LytTR family DNA-binding domain-containing protein [Pontibacter sp. SGAir0037]|uniref:LytR/AlgR family response regulator transcription factor n=1 Tax=Pontibacter sp. SGAir0037 TaxID=2571030 RepID=UPI0010CD56DC|nr:LytTR family DNA-binding domain-containing protein [Pontibacter sp. SGAir0037]QCR22040.1 DNA-binding response regulator [Pontibacter sp. SGAir0037]
MSSSISCIAIDDEPIALKVIQSHALKVPFLELENVFVSAAEALNYIQQQKVNLIFLDINMPDITGIEFAKLVPPQTKVIFTTAYPDYAVEGFELAATDYILKPISFARFLKACTRVQEQISAGLTDSLNPGEEFLFVKDGFSMVRINLENLLYVKADDNYLTFQESQQRTVARMTMTDAVEKLVNKSFLRVHKSYIISLSKIEKIERHQVIVAGNAIPLSTMYRDDLLQRLALTST